MKSTCRRIIHRSDEGIAAHPNIKFQKLTEDRVICSACDGSKELIAVVQTNGVLHIWNVSSTPVLQSAFDIIDSFEGGFDQFAGVATGAINWSSCAKFVLLVFNRGSKDFSRVILINIEERARVYAISIPFLIGCAAFLHGKHQQVILYPMKSSCFIFLDIARGLLIPYFLEVEKNDCGAGTNEDVCSIREGSKKFKVPSVSSDGLSGATTHHGHYADDLTLLLHDLGSNKEAKDLEIIAIKPMIAAATLVDGGGKETSRQFLIATKRRLLKVETTTPIEEDHRNDDKGVIGGVGGACCRIAYQFTIDTGGAAVGIGGTSSSLSNITSISSVMRIPSTSYIAENEEEDEEEEKQSLSLLIVCSGSHLYVINSDTLLVESFIDVRGLGQVVEEREGGGGGGGSGVTTTTNFTSSGSADASASGGAVSSSSSNSNNSIDWTKKKFSRAELLFGSQAGSSSTFGLSAASISYTTATSSSASSNSGSDDDQLFVLVSVTAATSMLSDDSPPPPQYSKNKLKEQEQHAEEEEDGGLFVDELLLFSLKRVEGDSGVSSSNNSNGVGVKLSLISTASLDCGSDSEERGTDTVPTDIKHLQQASRRHRLTAISASADISVVSRGRRLVFADTNQAAAGGGGGRFLWTSSFSSSSSLVQRTSTDFPGTMYPAGFSLMKRLAAYIEREDELDVSALPTVGIATTAAVPPGDDDNDHGNDDGGGKNRTTTNSSSSSGSSMTASGSGGNSNTVGNYDEDEGTGETRRTSSADKEIAIDITGTTTAKKRRTLTSTSSSSSCCTEKDIHRHHHHHRIRFTLYGEELRQYQQLKVHRNNISSSSSLHLRNSNSSNITTNGSQDAARRKGRRVSLVPSDPPPPYKRPRKDDLISSAAYESEVIGSSPDLATRGSAAAMLGDDEKATEDNDVNDNDGVDGNDDGDDNEQDDCANDDDDGNGSSTPLSATPARTTTANANAAAAASMVAAFLPPRRVLTGDYSLRLEKELSAAAKIAKMRRNPDVLTERLSAIEREAIENVRRIEERKERYRLKTKQRSKGGNKKSS